MMRCPTCGAEVETGVFPGGSVTCVCGQVVVVPKTITTLAQGAGPYRKADVASPGEKPARPPGEAPGPRCPTCSLPMTQQTLEGYPVSFCERRHGVFVQTETLESMIAEAVRNGNRVLESPLGSTQPSSTQPVRYVRCPLCTEVMGRRVFGGSSGVLVDVCIHGTWFDAGELELALAFAGSGRLRVEAPRPAPPANSTLAEQAKAMMDVSLLEEARREREAVERSASLAEEAIFTIQTLLGIPTTGRWRW